MTKPQVAVVMGSDSDWSVMSDAAQVLKDFGLDYEVEVLSAHMPMTELVARLNSFQPSAPVCARRASWSGRRTAAKGIHSICWIPTGTDWKSMQATWIAASPLSDSNPMRVLSGSTEPNSPLLGTKMVVTIAALPQHALRQQMLEHPVHLLQRQ